MDQRISFVSIATADLTASRRFYVEGLGWEPALDVPGEVVMLGAGERLVLSLWDRAAFEAEVGESTVSGPGVLPFSLAHNVETPGLVDEVLGLAASAGAQVRLAADRAWGGYTGYFADPDGVRWEVAWNPGPIGLQVVPGTDTTPRV